LCITRLGHTLINKLRNWTRQITTGPVIGAVIDSTRSRQQLMLENALLRQQLLVLTRQVKRPKVRERDRMVIVWLASWKTAVLIVKPETVLRWHRELFRWVWRHKSNSKRTGVLDSCGSRSP
jgi:hypothetical protein